MVYDEMMTKPIYNNLAFIPYREKSQKPTILDFLHSVFLQHHNVLALFTLIPLAVWVFNDALFFKGNSENVFTLR